ncbi:MAG: VirB3 family type IV secretion system protein [Methyloligellaceae bacterium]
MAQNTYLPEQILPGFVVPLHRSLTERILLGGAPRNYVITICTLAAVLGLGLRLFVTGALVWGLGMALGIYAARRDPQFMDVTLRHIKHKGELGC